MCEVDPKTNVEARSLVWRLFRDSADEDYLVARWSIGIDLHFQFAWSAQQAIEKYLKCALLLNGISVRNFGHSLLPMYDKLFEISDGLLPLVLVPPRGFPIDRSGPYRLSEPLRDFIERIEAIGDPSNRYRHYSIVIDRFDLHKLDEACFKLRRLSIPLEMLYLENGLTYRKVLQGDPNFQFATLNFMRGKESDSKTERQRVFAHKNFSFFQDEAYSCGLISSGSIAYNSSLSGDAAWGRYFRSPEVDHQ